MKNMLFILLLLVSTSISAQKEEKEFGLAMLLGLPEYQLC